MVTLYKDRSLVALDKSKLQRVEAHVDGILTSASRGAYFMRTGLSGKELAIELPLVLAKPEREHLVTLYKAYGWPDVECETISGRKQTLILKL